MQQPITDQEVLDDLIDKVRSQFDLFSSKIPEMVKKLDRAGTGIVKDHRDAMDKGQYYREANKVVLACLQQFTQDSSPPRSLNIREFRAEVHNLYLYL